LISPRLLDAYWRARQSGRRAYQLARDADLNPSVFSALLNESIPVRRGDPRVLRIGAVLGVPPELCFQAAEREPLHVA
jgi:hypothetical protein